LRLKPNDADAYYGRGFAYGQKGDDDHVIQDLDQAIKINPVYAAAFYNRSKAYASQGDYLRAIADRVRFVWLKFGLVGIMIRLGLLALAVAVVVALSSKRFRKSLNLVDSKRVA
jgi:tetratricopeptide (TPR) repeat protein